MFCESRCKSDLLFVAQLFCGSHKVLEARRGFGFAASLEAAIRVHPHVLLRDLCDDLVESVDDFLFRGDARRVNIVHARAHLRFGLDLRMHQAECGNRPVEVFLVPVALAERQLFAESGFVNLDNANAVLFEVKDFIALRQSLHCSPFKALQIKKDPRRGLRQGKVLEM